MAALKADQRNAIPAKQFAFPEQRKEPLENASHVRNAIARFNQVEGVSDADRDAAWKRVTAAAKRFGVEVEEASWREIGSGPTKAARKAAAKKAVATEAVATKAAPRKAAKTR